MVSDPDPKIAPIPSSTPQFTTVSHTLSLMTTVAEPSMTSTAGRTHDRWEKIRSARTPSIVRLEPPNIDAIDSSSNIFRSLITTLALELSCPERPIRNRPGLTAMVRWPFSG